MTKQIYTSPAVLDCGNATVATRGLPGITVEALGKQPR